MMASREDLEAAIDGEGGVVPCQNAPDLFFEFEDKRNNSFLMARQLCGLCPVKEICLAYALEADEPFGVWGGLSPYERRVLMGRSRRMAG